MIQELQTRHGIMFVPDTDNAQYGWLVDTGASAEDSCIELVCALLDTHPAGMGQVIDAGANFGAWTLPLARHATKVWAFEPQTPIHKCLCRTVIANRDLWPRVMPINLALGAERGFVLMPELDITVSTNFGGVSQGEPHHEQPDAPMVRVPVISIDDLALEDVRFIKIDCEGAEQSIVEGACKTIERCRPIMVIEATHKHTDTAALVALVEGMGYGTENIGHMNMIALPL